MSLKKLSDLSDTEWKELFWIVRLDLTKEQDRIGLDEPSSIALYDWLGKFLDGGVGERLWGRAQGRALEFPRDRAIILRILKPVALQVLGQMRATAESSRKGAAGADKNIYSPPPSSQFPHLFITHLSTMNTTGPRKHYLVDVTKPTSLPIFLEKIRSKAGDEMSANQYIKSVQIEIAGKNVDIAVEDPEGEWDWGLVMGILLYSGIPVGSSTYVKCLVAG